MTLKDPRCVYQILKKHYDRYDSKKVSAISGSPEDQLLAFYKAYTATGKPDKAGTILYAMGWTQHTVGVQNIRAMSIIQLLLGNMGVAGGGVNALRGESNVQGSTDQALLFHIIPGYMATPRANWATLEDYNKANTPVSKDPKSVNWWQHKPKYMASLLKSFYKEAEFAHRLQLDAQARRRPERFLAGALRQDAQRPVQGLLRLGHEPCSQRRGLQQDPRSPVQAGLDGQRQHIRERDRLLLEGPGRRSQEDQDRSLLPALRRLGRKGRLHLQLRPLDAVALCRPESHGESKPDGDIIYELALKIRELYKKDKGAFPDPILGLNVDDWGDGHVFDPHKVAKLINGYFLKNTTIKGADGKETVYKAGSQVPSFVMLQADGSTCSGNWIYTASYTDKGNMSERRDKTQTPGTGEKSAFSPAGPGPGRSTAASSTTGLPST